MLITLAAPGITATVVPEAGGRLGSLVVRGRELLVPAADPRDRSMRWGCYLMAPWAGRIADGRVAWGDRVVQLPRNHGRHAIHGLVYDRGWQLDDRSASSVTLWCRLPREWPARATVRQWISVGEGRLEMRAEILADEPMPAVLGWHPWFARGAAGEAVRVRLDADAVLETRGMIPTGRRLPIAGRHDLRDGPPLGRRRLDDAYTGVRLPIEIAWPDLRLRIDVDPPTPVAVVYSPAHAVCVEPQTAAPNALALARPAAERAGVRWLGAGETFSVKMTVAERPG